jgi:LAO/AO transport system kinase
LESLSSRNSDTPQVLRCSALHNQGIDIVWEAIERRYSQMKESGELAERHRQQSTRWLWKIVDDRVRQATRNHPAVLGIRDGLERDVLSGRIAPESAARQILEAFGLSNGCVGSRQSK